MIDYLFYSNEYCKFCLENKTSTNICKICYERLEFIDGIKHTSLGNAYYPLFYNNFIKDIIKRFKYSSKTHLVKPLAEVLYNFYLSKNFNYDYISFVPMTTKDEFERGYNQSYLLAKELSKLLNVGIVDLAEKVKITKHQNKLDIVSRKINLKNSFKVYNKLEIDNKFILVIDDLVTTGETFTTLAKEVSKTYNVKIDLLVICSSHIDQ